MLKPHELEYVRRIGAFRQNVSGMRIVEKGEFPHPARVVLAARAKKPIDPVVEPDSTADDTSNYLVLEYFYDLRDSRGERNGASRIWIRQKPKGVGGDFG